MKYQKYSTRLPQEIAKYLSLVYVRTYVCTYVRTYVRTSPGSRSIPMFGVCLQSFDFFTSHETATSHVFQAGHLVCSKQDISCVRSRTSPVFQAGHLLCSKQDIYCVPSRKSTVFQTGHLLFPKQDISCVPSSNPSFLKIVSFRRI